MEAASGTIPLSTQVGGHAGVLSSIDGSVVIKPCLPLEVEFYQALSSDDAFSHLSPFVPKFYGTLKLQGQMDDQGNIGAALGEDQGKDEHRPSSYLSIVLQNVAHSFVKPNVLDIKLGTVLWDESASPEKRERMEKTARETTSLETGVRLTGFEVYDHTEGKPVVTPKSYGKSIKAADLASGMAKFFPLANYSVPRGQGLPKEQLIQVLRRLLRDVKRIRAAVEATEMRMVGGSLLISYEADWEHLRKGLEESPKDTDDLTIEDGSDEDAENSDEEEGEKKGPPCIVKLIDFAHTRLQKGQGPDEGVLLGLDTTISLLQGRIDEVTTI